MLNRNEVRNALREHAPLVAPSLLACDFTQVEREIRSVEEAGARVLHLDVMDGHFVPNLSFGLPVIESIRRVTDLPLDVHLMIDNPREYVTRYRDAGADVITVHAEVLPDPREVLATIRSAGALAGLTLNPPTPLEAVLPYVEHCDLILVMSVMPGFGGQELDPVAFDKLRRLKAEPKCRALLEIDGGVNEQTIAACTAAGADLLVAGTAVFGAQDRTQRMQELQQLAAQGVGK
ncbi:MAG: ribulose-phosphate 3-epimerase [Planctomycetales bacterium]|nr:ribulose-phosphate 3-epimerase [Planctomycetales bacterium]